MAGEKLQYIIELVKQGDAKGAVAELKQLEDQGTKTAGTLQSKAASITAAFKAIAGAMVVREVIQFGREAVTAWEEQEKAVQRLEGTLRATNQFTKEYSQTLQDMASRQQEATNVADESILSAQAQLVAFGATRGEMERLTQVTLDLSAGMGTDLNSAAMLVGKALQGEFGALSRYGFQVDDTASRAENLASVLGQLEGRFKGLAGAMADQGGFRALSTQVGEFKEETGKLITETLAPALRDATVLLKDVTRVIKEMRSLQSPSQTPAGAAFNAAQWILPGGQAGLAAHWAATRMNRSLTTPPPGQPGAETEAANGNPLAGGTGDAAAMKRLEDQKQAVKELAAVKATYLLDTLSGYEREKAVLAAQFDERSTKLRELAVLAGLPNEEYVKMQVLLVNAHEAQQAVINDKREEHVIRVQLRIQEEMSQRSAEARKITEQEIAKLQADQASAMQMHQQMQLEVLTGKERELLANEQNYERRLSQIETLRITEEEAMMLREEAEAAHLARMQELHAGNAGVVQRQAETVTMGMQMMENGIYTFSSGAATALTKSFSQGGKAFQEFAASFMSQIGQMIMQMLILRAVSSFLGIGGGAHMSAPSPTGGMPTSISGSIPFADGGMVRAASGMMGMLHQPTYFPNYNVLAGEAGSEMMAVLAQPRTMNLGGISSIVGNVGASRVALMDIGPQMAAEGFASALPGGGRGGAGGAGGEMLVRIRLADGMKAEIIDQAITGARVAVENDLQQDSAIRSSVKEIAA